MSQPPVSVDDRRGLSPVTILVLIGLVVAALFAASAFLPRWWSHRIGNRVDGSFASGIGLGLALGFAFTLVAVVVLWVGLLRIRHWKGRLILLAVALLVAVPNLLTLGIAVGPGGGAHAGERTLDVEAPGFRASSLIGAVLAVLALAALGLLLRSRRRSREDTAALRAELDAARRSPAPNDDD